MEVDNKQLLEKLSNVQKKTIGEAKDVVAEAIALKKSILAARELFTELTLMEVDNKQLLEKLSNVQNMTIGEAKDVVAEAIALKKSILESKKETIEEEDALQEAINNKREQEAEKQAILSQNSGLTALADFLETSDTNEVVEETPLADYFKKHENLSKKNREVIMEISKSFEPAEALKMLELADDIKAWENGKTFGFIVAMLREWAENDVKTVSQAESFYKVNYNDIPEKAPTAKKPSKPKEGKSNVPKWSNPDYKNELDPKIIDELIAFHELYGTLDTPEAQEEIAQKRAEIEKKRAELEAKKWELLGKLDKA